ncbi:MAG: PAS domain S-box protein [Nitrospiraceae bacterium]|nr:MAG: PAS domain S-box protein [Nitrospiraceae bacterium]
MKAHLFRRIFLIYFLVLLLSVIFIELYVTNVVRSGYISNLKDSLSIQAGIISENIPFSQAAALDEFCRRIKEKTGARVTVIDINGKVLGDSDNDSLKMDNHADRLEIRQAIVSDTGWSVRHSDTLKHDFLYLARKITNEGRTDGFVRLAVPLKDVAASVNALRLKINISVILIILLSGLVLTWQMERIRRFVNRISDYADALAHGFLKKRLRLEGAGEFTGLAHNLNDMASEMELSIAQRDEKANRLNVIIKNIPDALLLINTRGVIELSNNAARELFGLSELEGRQFMEVVRNQEFLSLVDQVRSSRATGSADLVIDYPEQRHLSVMVSPISYTVGEIAGVAAIFHDMTRVERLEQMRKDFVANVSHEIKTPITAIKGFAETLLDGALYDKEHAVKFLQTITDQSERINRLVDDLLTLSSVELGVIKMNKKKVDVSDVIDRVIEAVVVQAAARDILVKKSVGTDAIIISADRDRLEQILLNLVDNAVKFTERGDVRISAQRAPNPQPLTPDAGPIEITVSDTGIGIPLKHLFRLGERFYRVDSSRSRELGGTGLGLAIVKHLVKAHGWEMEIESTPGKGTAVKIIIPA